MLVDKRKKFSNFLVVNNNVHLINHFALAFSPGRQKQCVNTG